MTQHFICGWTWDCIDQEAAGQWGLTQKQLPVVLLQPMDCDQKQLLGNDRPMSDWEMLN